MLLLLFNNTRALAGAVLGQSDTSAHLAALRSVIGGATGASSVSGSLVRIRSLLARAAVGQGTTSGAFRAYRVMRARAVGSSAASAHLARLLPFDGILLGWSDTAAVLEAIRRLVKTPGIRVVFVPIELRALAVAESRSVLVGRELRRVLASAENRMILVPAEVRRIAA